MIKDVVSPGLGSLGGIGQFSHIYLNTEQICTCIPCHLGSLFNKMIWIDAIPNIIPH